MKEEIIKLLKESDNYVSGEEISKGLGITRASVWKHIKVLKEDVYEIVGVSNKGYKLVNSPDLILKSDINKYLTTRYIGQNIEYFKSLSSTNDKAKLLGNSIDIKDGTIIIAEEQSGGKGRLGRYWSSPKGGLWLSIILRPNIEPTNAHKITQIASAALIKTLNNYGIDAKIKWPNDIYLNNKKICGILTEMKCDMDRINYIVVGVGINVNINSNNILEELKNTATSLKIETNISYDRNKLLALFLNNFEYLYIDFIEKNIYSEVAEISKTHSLIINKQAFLVTSRGKEKVNCIGLDDNGELIVLDENGNIKNILSGEITFK